MSDSFRPHGLYNLWNFLGQNTAVGSLSLLQGVFPIQGSNPGLPHRRQILYQLSHKGTNNPGKIIKNVGSSKDSDSTGPKVLGTCILKNCIYIYSFIFGCAKALLLCRLFCSCGKCWLLSICGAQASRCSGFSCCGAWL